MKKKIVSIISNLSLLHWSTHLEIIEGKKYNYLVMMHTLGSCRDISCKDQTCFSRSLGHSLKNKKKTKKK